MEVDKKIRMIYYIMLEYKVLDIIYNDFDAYWCAFEISRNKDGIIDEILSDFAISF